MSIEILNRYTGAVLYSSTIASDIAAALFEAAQKGAYLSGAYLRGANLSGANLSGATVDAWSLIIPASRHVITVYPDCVAIGCHERTIESWLKIYERVGRDEGYTEEQIEEYGAHLRRAKAITDLLAQVPVSEEASHE